MKTFLSYYLLKLEKGFVFNITSQSSEVDRYLERNGSYKASNGWVITADVEPELDASRKKIYLRGLDRNADQRVDRTMYLKSNDERDSIVKAANEALREFVKAVRKDGETRSSEPAYIRLGSARLVDLHDANRYSEDEVIIIGIR